jgi:hypothetical protein
LWQITVWPEDYSEAERAMAAKYFRNDLVRGPVRMKAGDDRVFFDNAKPLAVSQKREGADAERGHDDGLFFWRFPAIKHRAGKAVFRRREHARVHPHRRQIRR